LEGLQKLPEPVGSNVPTNAETFAKITAAVQIGGGVLLATGKVPRLASAALAATVIPANLGAHMFWNEADPERKAQQRRALLTDVSLLGGLIIASADTAGKPSLGWRGRRTAQKLTGTVAAALPVGAAKSASLLDSEFGERVQEGLHAGAERGRELAGVAAERSAPLLHAGAERSRELAEAAAERSAPLLEAARERGTVWAELARERGAELAGVARERGSELAEAARERSVELAEAARERSAEIAEAARDQSEEVATGTRKRARTLRSR
jgi:uncharacterized membrane protein YphA (DoxX/SURF4 family)